MKIVFRNIIFLTLFFIIYNDGFGQEDWINFKAPNGFLFSVDVPGEMEESSQTIKTAVGDLKAVTYAYQGNTEDPNYLYLINLVQYPEGTFPVDSIDLIDEYLENAILSSIEKVNGELSYSSNLERNNGKLFRVKYNNGQAVLKAKSFITKDVFISLQVFTVQSKSLNDEMDYFLDSFRINP
ncbi:MAG: hypothetical protein AAGA77_13105 [Bacteroidota bacterium]